MDECRKKDQSHYCHGEPITLEKLLEILTDGLYSEQQEQMKELLENNPSFKDKISHLKLESMRLLSDVIAHELRTPLSGIQVGLKGFKRYFAILLDGYQKARDAGLPVEPIRTAHLNTMENAFDALDRQTTYALTFIDMTLMNMTPHEKIDHLPMSWLSIRETIENALNTYPFAEGERALIQMESNDDFDYYGSQWLMTYVLYNLIKNALYSIKAAEKGQISIFFEKGTHQHRLVFSDTGMGMSSEICQHIFDVFYTQTHGGMGVGLTFCKKVIDTFGGFMECESEYRQYTRFIITLPGKENPVG